MAADLYIHSMTTIHRKDVITNNSTSTLMKVSEPEGLIEHKIGERAFYTGHTDVTEKDLQCFFANTLGSKHFDLSRPSPCNDNGKKHWECSHWNAVSNSDRIHIGEVSWLKAALFNDQEYIPEPVETISALIREDLPVLDDELYAYIINALYTPRTRAHFYGVTDVNKELIEWLDAHKGHRLFTVSW